ncbi:uncharacterized protein ACNLHF_014826 [Anomaloglossus baeobatrachus]|uniref:uncharacterized protein LOC142302038 n=1 Tax=Anomaloglossus baeobatrachus TaxID=238106 RepID=UPI003F50AB6E
MRISILFLCFTLFFLINYLRLPDDPLLVDPRKSQYETSIRVPVWLFRGAAFITVMSVLILIEYMAYKLVQSKWAKREKPSHSDPESKSILEELNTSLAPASNYAKESPRRKFKVGFSKIVWVRTIPNENIGRKARSSTEHNERFLIYQRNQQPRTPEPRTPEPRPPEPRMAPAPQDSKETPKRKFKVGFSDIVWVRTIPNDNRGKRARSSTEHNERFLIYQRNQQPRTPEPRTPEPRPPEPRMAPAPQDSKETPKRKFKVGFSDIVWVRSIPNDNTGKRARSSTEHNERLLIFERNPQLRTPEPKMLTTTQPRIKKRSFFSRCFRGEND